MAQHHGWPVPNYHRVYRIIKQLDPALLTLAHEGSHTYRTTYDLLYRHEAKQANDIWQADHTLLDIWVRHGHGPPVRPWLTVIMDDYSRAIAGFRLSLEAPAAIQTALALRQAIWRKAVPHWKITGIPATFYTEYVPRNNSKLCGHSCYVALLLYPIDRSDIVELVRTHNSTSPSPALSSFPRRPMTVTQIQPAR